MDSKIFHELEHSYHENKLAHAFLLETNEKEKTYKEILQFLKLINCPNSFKENCSTCNLCHLIDTNSLPSLITIYPDGINIKKEQILELKKSFQTKPIFSKYNMYIIMDAEKLNASSANTMLKFLEEPEDHIIGFFLTNNRENVIETIKSRCQILLENYEEIEDHIPEDIWTLALDYIMEIETTKTDAVLYNRDVLSLKIKEKNDCFFLFQAMLNIYRNVYFGILNIENLDERFQSLSFLLKKDSKDIFKKICLIVEILDELNYNLNISLALDRFVLEVGD